MNPTRSNKWKFIVITTAIARRSESRVPAPHYNHCHDCSTPRRLGQYQMLTLYTQVGVFRRSAHETISSSESRSVFCDVIVCVLIERAHRFWTGVCLSDTGREIVMKLGHLYHERLLRGVATAKGLSCRCGLYRRRRILDSNRLGDVSSMGIAELEFATRDCAFVNRFSDRCHTRLGIRHYCARNSGHPDNTGAHRRRNLILLIVTAVIISASAGFLLLPRAVWHKIDKSVAVLPFQNLSSDPDNAYFADGIQEEVLTRLAKIGDLKVISRTSTQGYQSEPGNLAEIAKQLGVANILEGSVQKAGDQVRVNVHLVNVQTGSQLWAETYDRKLSDIFGVETEIAKGIAESLQAKLTGREEQALAAQAHK